MNKLEKKYLQSIYNQISMEENFSNIKDRIQIEVAPKNIYSIILKILMPCEIIVSCICFGLFFLKQMKALPENTAKKNIETILLTLGIGFFVIFVITLIIYRVVKYRKV